MPQANDTAAALLGEYAELLVMTGGDRLRARAYEKAARAIGGHPADISALSPAALQRIPGVGKSIAEKVGEIGRTGTFAALEALRADIPDGVLKLARIPALGARRAPRHPRRRPKAAPYPGPGAAPPPPALPRVGHHPARRAARRHRRGPPGRPA